MGIVQQKASSSFPGHQIQRVQVCRREPVAGDVLLGQKPTMDDFLGTCHVQVSHVEARPELQGTLTVQLELG